MDAYRAPGWLPGGHLQTIVPALFSHTPDVRYRRERWNTPDGDFIDLDWIGDRPQAPLVVLFHGLEGSSQSHYAKALMARLLAAGWNGCVPHFRGCSGEANLAPRAYHAGDSAEVDWIVRQMRRRHAQGPLFLAGVSLGGNQLLKWLGEQGAAAQAMVAAAAAVSAPLDLVACGRVLDYGVNRQLYTRNFLKTLKPKAIDKLRVYPGLANAEQVARARTFKEFDRLFTAPVHGYIDHQDYWQRASSKPLLKSIAVPTLLLNARNDPFIPDDALPHADEVAACVECEFPATGGHVGFAQGTFPGHVDWLPQRLLGFFSGHLQPD